MLNIPRPLQAIHNIYMQVTFQEKFNNRYLLPRLAERASAYIFPELLRTAPIRFNRHTLSHSGGFTLLELLVVITLLAILSSVALMSNDGVRDQAEVDATKYEMAELRKALLQFRQDTGAFPGQGVYACGDLVAGAEAQDAANGAGTWPAGAPAAVVATPAPWVAWCNSPANLWMLFIDPIPDGSGAWNPDTKRGWHGPYLTKSGPGYVDVGSESNVRGIADGFASPAFLWRVRPTDTETVQAGSPYVLLELAGVDARVASFGPDAADDGVNADKCLPNDDDIVLCLLK